MSLFRVFRVDLVIGALALVVAYLYGGPTVAVTAALLILVEIVFSFDNATVNAKYLKRMNHFWRKIFLTVGVLVAVFGMRLIFPFIVVCLSGHVSPVKAVSLAFAKGNPEVAGTYGFILNHAHPAIAGFGGAFLLMLFLDFMFDSERDVMWLRWLEAPLQKIGKLDVASVVVVLGFLAFISKVLLTGRESNVVLLAGVFGVITYLLVNGLTGVMEASDAARTKALGLDDDGPSVAASALLAGKAALTMFIFLEVMDASFSFDGVIGAFAITQDPIVIALGLGVGALVVRTLTVHLVDTGALDELKYLETGAHWAIGSLAVLMLLSTRFELPDLVVGLVGIAFITAAFISSKMAKDEAPVVAAPAAAASE